MSTPNPSLEATRAPALLAITWLETAIAVILLTMRFWARISIRALGIDDWVSLCSVVVFIVSSCMATKLCSVGGFRHLASLTPEQQLATVYWNWIAQPFSLFNFGLSKLAAGLLVNRILSPQAKTQKRFLAAVLIILSILTVFVILEVFLHCNPPRALWDVQLQKEAKCWSPEAYVIMSELMCVWYVFVDFTLAAMAISLVWKLQLSRRQRIGLSLLLGQGILAGICGIAKMPYIRELVADSDLTWVMFPLFVFTSTEIALIIYAGCIPTLKPLFDRAIKLRQSLSNRTLVPSRSSSTKADSGHQTEKDRDIWVTKSVNVESTSV